MASEETSGMIRPWRKRFQLWLLRFGGKCLGDWTQGGITHYAIKRFDGGVFRWVEVPATEKAQAECRKWVWRYDAMFKIKWGRKWDVPNDGRIAPEKGDIASALSPCGSSSQRVNDFICQFVGFPRIINTGGQTATADEGLQNDRLEYLGKFNEQLHLSKMQPANDIAASIFWKFQHWARWVGQCFKCAGLAEEVIADVQLLRGLYDWHTQNTDFSSDAMIALDDAHDKLDNALLAMSKAVLDNAPMEQPAQATRAKYAAVEATPKRAYEDDAQRSVEAKGNMRKSKYAGRVFEGVSKGQKTGHKIAVSDDGDKLEIYNTVTRQYSIEIPIFPRHWGAIDAMLEKFASDKDDGWVDLIPRVWSGMDGDHKRLKRCIENLKVKNQSQCKWRFRKFP